MITMDLLTVDTYLTLNANIIRYISGSVTQSSDEKLIPESCSICPVIK